MSVAPASDAARQRSEVRFQASESHVCARWRAARRITTDRNHAAVDAEARGQLVGGALSAWSRIPPRT